MGRITIPQLEAFFWTTELGSVQKAATRLNVAQPTLSLRLRQLDAAVESPLLERAGRGLRMTRHGHIFLNQAKQVLDAYRQMENASTASALSGVLRIGLAEGFATACLPALIPALRAEFPQLQPEWKVATSAGLEQDLVEANLDLAVLVDAVGHRNIRLAPLGMQKTVWAASRKLRIKPRATASELSRFTVITTPPPTAMYRATVGWFADAGRQPGALCICTSLNAAAQLVGEGLGVGVFPARMIEAYRMADDLVALVCEPPLAPGRVYVADRVTADPARTAAIIRVCQDVTSSIGYFEPKEATSG
jgi:DNA-binding transcriptional LysR family regulator